MFPVDPRYLHCTIYLYPTADDARNGESAGGTGFLVSVPSERHEGISHVFAVTNRHVVVGKQPPPPRPAPVVRMNRITGGTDVLPLRVDQWIGHPMGDDVTVAYVRAADLHDFQYETVPVDRFVTHTNAFPPHERERTHGFNVWVGAPCIMVGRFVSQEGRQRNTPAVRFGNVSMLPGEPIRNAATGCAQESFLVEVHSIGGFSGSPVFMCFGSSSMWEGGLSVLLGINWGHIHRKQRVTGSDGKAVDPAMYVETNAGQAMVVPAWKLRELLDSGEVMQVRHGEDERIARARASSSVTADSLDESAEPRSPRGPEPERLKIDATFEDAARKLARTPRPEGGWPKG